MAKAATLGILHPCARACTQRLIVNDETNVVLATLSRAIFQAKMEKSLEIVSNRLFFQIRSDNPSTGIHMDESDGFIYNYHCMDSLYKTIKIRKYFGPMTISAIHKHCALVDANLKHTAGRHLYYTNNAEMVGYQQKRTSAIFLMGCYLIVRKDWSPDKTQETFQELAVSLTPYTDMEGSTAHALSLLDCWRALYHGTVVHRWFRKVDTKVDITLNDGSEDVMNWVVPDKLIAMEDPKEPRYMGRGPRVRPSIVDFFKMKRVDTVVRHNAKDYEFRTSYGQPYHSEEFVCRAIKHHDIFFRDGGIPSDSQLNSFLKVVKRAKNGVAVHCHAGRGRTGTMLACALVRFWGFEATQAIAWVRMCRVACIVGIQQGFIKMVESRLVGKKANAAVVCRQSAYLGGKVIPVPQKEEEESQEKRSALGEYEDNATTHLRPRERVTIKRRHHTKPTKAYRRAGLESHTKRSSAKSVEEVTVLPINGALSEARRGKQRAISNMSKTNKSQKRIFLEQHLSNLAKTKTNKTRSDIREVGSKTQPRLQNEKTKPGHDRNILKKMQPFLEKEHKSKHLRAADSGHKADGYLAKPNSKATIVEITKAKRLQGLTRCQITMQKSVPYELKERAAEDFDEILNAHPTKGQIRGSKSSIPFARPQTKYTSYQPTLEHLAKLLNIENECNSPVPSCAKEYKDEPNWNRSRGGSKSAQNRSKKSKDAVDIRLKVERRPAWLEQDPGPQSSMKADASLVWIATRNGGRKDSRAIKNHFLEKQKKELLLYKSAQYDGASNAVKIRNA